jgi:hypothetical protein
VLTSSNHVIDYSKGELLTVGMAVDHVDVFSPISGVVIRSDRQQTHEIAMPITCGHTLF